MALGKKMDGLTTAAAAEKEEEAAAAPPPPLKQPILGPPLLSNEIKPPNLPFSIELVPSLMPRPMITLLSSVAPG